MSKIISIFIIIILIIALVTLVAGVFLIVKFNKNKNSEVPFPFNSMYSALSEIVFIRSILDYLQRSFYLIHVNKAKSEVLASLCVILMPVIFVILFTFINMLSPVWYLSILIFCISGLIPFYVLRSYVVKRCIQVRMSLLRSFTSLSSLLSTGTIATASEDMIFSTSGSVREIYKEFLRLYHTDKSEAYVFINYISGDNYVKGVVDTLRLFDEEGEDPSEEINKICKQGLDILSLQLLGFRRFTDLKLSSCVLLGASIVMRSLGNYLADMMHFQYSEILGFLCITMIILSLTLGFAFESSV